MTPDELQQQEELGRKIAAALAPLGLTPGAVQSMVAVSTGDFVMLSTHYWRAHMAFKNSVGMDATTFARAAGVAAYFEEQGK